ncbi:unnamed protein product [Protopolystoma xenopodis]|uniref:LIM zinc-binding domain-containing protein n=1 Tax=Protopolystoma xenopodis TaxID=117903 RepID=A0A3S5B6X7_9PLAT|nr:unnamed protein product [Protopolystoma xenopodis]
MLDRVGPVLAFPTNILANSMSQIILEPPPMINAASASYPVVCKGCGGEILERYLVHIAGEYWHEECATCCICLGRLAKSCFVRNSRLYCRHDYLS